MTSSVTHSHTNDQWGYFLGFNNFPWSCLADPASIHHHQAVSVLIYAEGWGSSPVEIKIYISRIWAYTKDCFQINLLYIHDSVYVL